MAIETWTSPYAPDPYSTPPGMLRWVSGAQTKPPGDGWTITGYRTTKGGQIVTKGGIVNPDVQVPIYSRIVPESKSPATTVKPQPETIPAKPIDLGTSDSKNTSSSSGTDSKNPVIQDFKLAEQAAAQKNYLDDTLTKRMEKFQNLLNSLSL